MFEKLKEKLKNWTKNLTQKATEEVKEEKPVETPIEKKEKLKEKLKKQTKKKKEKEVSKEPEKIQEPEVEKEIKEIPIPLKFIPGTEKYEPDLEKIQEIKKEFEKQEKARSIEDHEYKEPEKKPVDEEEREIGEKIWEDIKEESKKKGFFKRIFSKITKVKISEKEFEIYSEELKMLLLENNVAYEVAEKIIKKLGEEIVGKEFLKKEIEPQIEQTLKEIIEDILIEPFEINKKINDKKEKPYIILFCGINGTGKTTTIAKIAQQIQKKGLSCVMAAADTFRAASIEQIKKHADKLKIKLISHDYGSDPAAVGFDAIKYAQKNRIDVVLIDTAGRMHSEKNLLKELEKIARVCKPDLKIFVGEAITGNDSIEQVRSFDWAIGIDGIILTKADTDEKGGTALSVGYVTKKPILYLGTGQEYSDLIPFEKQKFIKELGL